MEGKGCEGTNKAGSLKVQDVWNMIELFNVIANEAGVAFIGSD